MEQIKNETKRLSPLRIALTKGRLEKKAISLLEKMGYDCENAINKGRKLIVRVKSLDGKSELELVFAKAADCLTYVDAGVCDMAIVGKDTIEEDEKSFYEICDLGFGKCNFAVAAPKGKDPFEDGYKIKCIATKYPHIAKRFFEEENIDVSIVKIEGSVELAPLLSLADAIVDIVETGTTLRENGLYVAKYIMEVSAKLIVNTASLKLRKNEIEDFAELAEKNKALVK